MIPYLAVFIFTPLFTYYSEKNFKNNEKIKGVLFAILTILLPSIIAGIRHISMGVDGTIYVEPVLRSFKGLTISKAWGLHKIEKGYIILTYIISTITMNPNVMLFIISLIINYFVFMTAYKLRNNVNMTLFMIIFVLYFYTKSLNIMRQAIGISIFMYSLTFLKKKDYLKTFLYTFLAVLFHDSILICCFIYVLYFINNLKIKPKTKMMIISSLMILVMFFSFNIKWIVKILVVDLNIIAQKYDDYLTNIHNFKFNFLDLFVKIFLFILAWIVCRYEKNKEERMYNLTMLESVIIGLILTISMAYIGQSGEIHRLSFSFVYIGTSYLISKIFFVMKKNHINQYGISLMIISVLSFFWIVSYIIGHEAQLYPFIFM